MNESEIWAAVQAACDELVAFAQKLVQTPSLSGQEGDAAALIQAEMVRLGYDEARLDEAGNVVGRLAGGDGPRLMLNGHMDHVEAGLADRWPYPPFGGEIHEGALWGRGAADMKGALAAMVYAGGVIRRLGVAPPGDCYVAAVVQEEVGGLGTRHLARTLPVERAVIGEASSNHLRRGHRGRVELMARLEGRSVHASMPDLGVNPHYSMARFVASLRDLPMAADPVYGSSTVAPTHLVSEPGGGNVTPSTLCLVLDWRNIPGESQEAIVDRLEALLACCLEPGCRGWIELPPREMVSYTGFRMSYANTFPSFTTAEDHPWLRAAQGVLAAVLGREVEVGTWRFATDGGYLAAAGATVLGFGPGDAAVVHTVEERLALDELMEGVVGYVALCLM